MKSGVWGVFFFISARPFLKMWVQSRRFFVFLSMDGMSAVRFMGGCVFLSMDGVSAVRFMGGCVARHIVMRSGMRSGMHAKKTL